MQQKSSTLNFTPALFNNLNGFLTIPYTFHYICRFWKNASHLYMAYYLYTIYSLLYAFLNAAAMCKRWTACSFYTQTFHTNYLLNRQKMFAPTKIAFQHFKLWMERTTFSSRQWFSDAARIKQKVKLIWVLWWMI